jgi:hypothetical protein
MSRMRGGDVPWITSLFHSLRVDSMTRFGSLVQKRGQIMTDDTPNQLTPLQRRLIDAAADIIETQADSPEFLHSVLCQVGPDPTFVSPDAK